MGERQLEQTEELVERERELALQAIRNRGRHPQCHDPQYSDFNGRDCFDCGDPLHPVRLGLGRVRCVPCQELTEKAGSA